MQSNIGLKSLIKVEVYTVIKVKSVSKHYGSVKVLDEFSFDFKKGKITCLYGPSGCGKTTLLNIIAGLLKSSGTIEFGENETKVERKVSYIFQEDRLIPWKTAIENVCFVLEESCENDQVRELSIRYLKLVGLSDQLYKYPHELSGGMKRRVSIARAFAYPSEILLMDEPFKGLDKKLKTSIIEDFLKIWNEDKRTVLLVTHDEYEAEALSDEILYLDGCPMKIIKVEENERKVY